VSKTTPESVIPDLEELPGVAPLVAKQRELRSKEAALESELAQAASPEGVRHDLDEEAKALLAGQPIRHEEPKQHRPASRIRHELEIVQTALRMLDAQLAAERRRGELHIRELFLPQHRQIARKISRALKLLQEARKEEQGVRDGLRDRGCFTFAHPLQDINVLAGFESDFIDECISRWFQDHAAYAS
jgi:hypothetical protein